MSVALQTPASSSSDVADMANRALARLMKYIESCHYRGYDPYDGLNSPVLRTFGLLGKYPRIAAIQGMKRSPINFRRVLGVKKGYNPKGLGLFLWGYAKLQASEDRSSDYSERIETLLKLIDQTRSPGCTGNGWGYNFDWQSRAFYVPKETPTIVNSSFIGHALLDLHEMSGHQTALDLAIPIKDFILGDLGRTECGDSFCFSYTPIDETPVHNANLLGASLLIRINRYVGDDSVRSAALSALEYTMRHQHAEGSWWYAEPEYQHWIDSFHTGFNLQAIGYFLAEGESEEHRASLEKGIEFYRDRFFLPNGTAKYYHDRLEPIDIHAYAQAIVFFSQLNRDGPFVDRIVRRFLKTFQSDRGYFYFQKTRYFTNRIPYMRWAQAWSFHALTEYVYARTRQTRDRQTC